MGQSEQDEIAAAKVQGRAEEHDETARKLKAKGLNLARMARQYLMKARCDLRQTGRRSQMQRKNVTALLQRITFDKAILAGKPLIVACGFRSI